MKFNGLSLPDSLLRDLDIYRDTVGEARGFYKMVVSDSSKANNVMLKRLKALDDDTFVILTNHAMRVEFETNNPDNGNSYHQEPLYLELIDLARTVRRYVRKTLWLSNLTPVKVQEMLNANS